MEEARLWKAVRRLHRVLASLLHLIRESEISSLIEEAVDRTALLRLLYAVEDVMTMIEERWSLDFVNETP